MDVLSEAVVLRKDGALQDVTVRVAEVRPGRDRVGVRFHGSGRFFPYSPQNVAVMANPRRVELDEVSRVEVGGVVWDSARSLLTFSGALGDWVRVVYDVRGDERTAMYPASDVRVIADAAAGPDARASLGHWREVVAGLAEDDPMRRVFDRLGFVHPDSALSSYLNAGPIAKRADGPPTIHPFSTNLSQREAVERALRHTVSVVEGPPGTGKTQTILNLIANVVCVRGQTVGVVSFNNAAVENVRTKLDELGIGFVVGSLGRAELREAFFERQPERERTIEQFLAAGAPVAPDLDHIAALDRRLEELQHHDRARAEVRELLDGYRLEQLHFLRHVDEQTLPVLDHLPLLRRSSDRILDYLAETQVPSSGRMLDRLGRRVRHYFRYGSVRGLNPEDTSTVLRLQAAYYDRRIAELETDLVSVEERLASASFDDVAAEHQAASKRALVAALHHRYGDVPRQRYTAGDYRRRFSEFLRDFPVILSTCHSLRGALPEGHLLDYLVIDEASQVNLLQAAAVLASCRNLVVVGDLKQLQHIVEGDRVGGPPSIPAHDYHRHNILSSLDELHGAALPRTMLREHYRCDPEIIGFCNRRFYDGMLIPYPPKDRLSSPLSVIRTVEGNHMRKHRLGGGRSNQREIDVITTEVLPRLEAEGLGASIGVTAPYRRQVSKVTDLLLDAIEADTVHKFQGRERDVIIMSTVLDESRIGRAGMAFVDDPHLVNVAVSRARKRFILVTDNDMLPTSRNLRELIDYILYRHPDQRAEESAIVSIFDLLYQRFSERLRSVEARLRPDAAYRSEEICRVVLGDVLDDPAYAGLTVVEQVLVRNLVEDVDALSPEARAYVDHRASVDFVIYSAVSRRAVLAVEVDGFRFHEDDAVQSRRDDLKNGILDAAGLSLLRLATTRSGEEKRIRGALDAALARTQVTG